MPIPRVQLGISIHAPAKGATQKAAAYRHNDRFQSTLPRRERLFCVHQRPGIIDFNPRSREGSDRHGGVVVALCVISIHAPAKGATCAVCHFRRGGVDFNPRSREGSDLFAQLFLLLGGLFQSTLPRRERRNFLPFSCSRGHFNPRSREGSDEQLLCSGCLLTQISIHAPAKGATHVHHLRTSFQRFQSTLPRRERLLHQLLIFDQIRFQSTLPRRERQSQFHAGPVLSTYFNPRSREGSDSGGSAAVSRCGDFNPRSREGSDPSV